MVKVRAKSKRQTESRQFFETLGAQIARIRQSQGYTQAELARRIGLSQQAVFAYELGERRVSLFVLDQLAKVFRVRMEEIMGWSRPEPISKRRLSPRAMRHAERLQALSKTQQRFVIRIIDNLEAHHGAAPGR
jgi:transcriptional regulator with XRE-family HTH domain